MHVGSDVVALGDQLPEMGPDLVIAVEQPESFGITQPVVQTLGLRLSSGTEPNRFDRSFERLAILIGAGCSSETSNGRSRHCLERNHGRPGSGPGLRVASDQSWALQAVERGPFLMLACDPRHHLNLVAQPQNRLNCDSPIPRRGVPARGLGCSISEDHR
jgi:hypothetical protein